MASITNSSRDKPMQAPPKFFSQPSSTMTNLAGRSASVDWRCVFLMWMVVVQYVMFFATFWPLMVAESSRGLIDFLNRDFHIPAALISGLFLFSIGITWRGIHPRWWLLLMLTGQAAYAFAAFAYAVHSDITLTQFAGHGGLFFLFLFGIIAQIHPPDNPSLEYLGTFKTRLIALSKTVLIPIIGVVLLLYAIGLTTRTDAGIAAFITNQFGSPLVVMLIFSLFVGAGVVIQNHIHASRLFVALIPQGIYACMAISLLGSDNGVSLTGVIVHLLFTITAMFIVLIQTKEYARALLLRQRRGE
jgi:hypothetical protein